MTSCVETSFPYREKNTVPHFDQELDRLYGSRYSCGAHFDIYGTDINTHVYVAHEAGGATAIFLFRLEKGRVTVLNEGITVRPLDANRFASYVFRKHASISAVSFRFVDASDQRYCFPRRRILGDTDMLYVLPASQEQYRAALGSSTRSNLNNHFNKLRRDYPTFKVDVYEGAAAPQQHVRRIIALQRLRMGDAGKVSMVDPAEEERVCACVARSGFVVILSIDGQLAAGSINYRLGRNFSARVISHDETFGKYRIGFLCAYLTICECIKTGNAHTFHFGWGQSDYKYRLGARSRQLYQLTLYRSRSHAVLSAGSAIGAGLRGQTLQLRQWFINAAGNQNGLAGRSAHYLLRRVRKLRAAAMSYSVRRGKA